MHCAETIGLFVYYTLLIKIELLYRLWEPGWKQRYYKNKFDVDASDHKFRRKVVQSYVEGLCWVLRYYYQVFNYLTISVLIETISKLLKDFQ